jgi:predicted acetyltransferase
VSVSVRDARSSQSDRLWIGSIYREYLDDLSALSTGIFPVLGEVGHREPDQIARWFGDRNAFPLIILKTAEPVAPRRAAGASRESLHCVPVGFAMVARTAHPTGPPVVDYRMAEFFITRGNRRLGVGRTAVNLILNRFAGRWEITEYLRNPGAVSFWRRVVAGYTRGSYQERVINGEVRQIFDSRVERPR